MSILSENPIFSYTKRDYESSRKEGLARIPILSNGHWTDLNATDPGVIILDYLHAIVDMMNFYQDHQAGEAFISTAKERANIFRIAKQLSYSIRSAKGATCEVVFTSYFTYDHPIKIPKYTTISTHSGISYLTTKDAYLSANTTTVRVPCTQGTLAQLVYRGTGISRFSNIPGASNQYVNISVGNIDIDSIRIKDDLGREWTPVDYTVFSSSKDRAYQVELNPDDSVTIKFGDGERGILPSETDVLTIEYIVTQAENGRVEANSLVNLESYITDAGKYVEFTVSNPQASAGGSSSQSSREIKELAPGAIKSQNRAVTLSDFENLAKMVAGVAEAKAYDINTNPDLQYHEVLVLIVPDALNINSVDVLKESVIEYLSHRMIPPTNLQVITPVYEPINISITVQKMTGDVGSLEYDIYTRIEEYFRNRIGAIGEAFYPSEIISLVATTPNVRYVVDMTPNTPVQISSTSIATLGEVTITVQ